MVLPVTYGTVTDGETKWAVALLGSESDARAFVRYCRAEHGLYPWRKGTAVFDALPHRSRLQKALSEYIGDQEAPTVEQPCT